MTYDERLGEEAVLDEVEQQWYKIAGILVMMLNEARGKPRDTEVRLTSADIERFMDIGTPEDQVGVLYHPEGDTIRLRALRTSQAKRIHREWEAARRKRTDSPV